MESVKNLVEYYDELYPVTDAQKKFYDSFLEIYPHPAHFLSIGCGTGMLEYRLAKDKYADVTGLETFKELLDSATRKQRTQLMSLRFFQMSTIEMSRFLGKGFYNVISCLNDRIVFIHDHTLMRKFFADCHQLLTDDGALVLSLTNYDIYNPELKAALPVSNTLRVKYTGKLHAGEEKNIAYLSRTVETGSGKKLPVFDNTEIYLLRPEEITGFAKEAGFKNVQLFDGFSDKEADENSDEIVALIKK